MFNLSIIIKTLLWPGLILVGFIIVISVVFDLILPTLSIKRRLANGKRWRNDQELLQWLRGMTPTQFEVYISDLFYHLGYETEAVGKSHDGGIDVIAKKNGITHYIQCKKYITREVTVSAVRDFYGAIANRLANGQGYLITTNKITLEARKFAEDKPIELIDGFRLIEYIRLANKETGDKKQEKSLAGSKCPECGGTLVARSGKFGSFYGCSNYPKCKYTTK